MKTRSILVIEPDSNLRELLQLCLTELTDWEVVTTASVRGGLNLAFNQTFEAILLAVSTAKVDRDRCLEFIQNLTDSPSTQSIPILLLVQQAEYLIPSNLCRNRIIHTVIKPFDPLTLSIQIAALLPPE